MAANGLLIATLFAIGIEGAHWLLLATVELSPVAARHLLVSFLGGSPLLFVYLGVLWLLRTGEPRRAARLLALGAGCAVAFSLPALLPALLAGRACSGYSNVGAALAFVPIGQAAVVVTALRARRSIGGADRASRWSLLWPVAFLLEALLVVPSPPLHDRLDRGDTSALVTIGRIRECARDHATRNAAAGYPPSLSSCAESSAIRSETSGHLIRYQPAAPDAGGRIDSYRVSARPREWGCTSWMSYWSDESGVLQSGPFAQPPDETGVPR